MAGTQGGHKATIVALFANFGIAIAKFFAFAFTGSAAMLAEGIHSVADTSNQALLLLGIHRSRRAPTAEHPFGYGRERYFWAFVVAIVLFTLGSVFSLFEGVEKLRHPHEISSLSWAIGVLAVAIALEAFALRTAVLEANRVRKGSWWNFVRRSKSPEIPVVLLEDIGAMFGLVFAMAGIVLARVTGEPRFDAIGSIAIGVLLGVIAIVLAAEMKSLLIGESAAPSRADEIAAAFRADEQLAELLDLKTLHLGPDELLVAAKVRLVANLNTTEVSKAIDRIEWRVRTAVPEATVMYVEPDLRDEPAGAQP